MTISEALREYEATLDVPHFFDFEDMKVEAVHCLADAARELLTIREASERVQLCTNHNALRALDRWLGDMSCEVGALLDSRERPYTCVFVERLLTIPEEVKK